MPNYAEMTTEELKEARSAFAAEIETADSARLDEISAAVDTIDGIMEQRKAAETQRRTLRDAVAAGNGEIIEEEKKMPEQRTANDIRSSEEYINAYADYIKTNDDRECRALMTYTTSGGTVPVPTYIEDGIRAAWDRSPLLQYVTTMDVRGIVGIGFEVSATDAEIHEEGTAAPAEEELVIGTVQLVPMTLKKWLRISDEVAELAGRAFLDYIMDEITAKILAAVRHQIIVKIDTAPAASSGIKVGVPKITATAASLSIVAQAAALLGDDAENLCVIMNRQTHAAFIEQIAANGYMFDPFAGYTVIYDNNLAVPGTSGSTTTWLVVGDLSGVTVNFPGGRDVKLKYDDLTEAQADMVKIVGRLSVAVGVTGPGKLAKVANNT